jgi:serine/threonine protein kinase
MGKTDQQRSELEHAVGDKYEVLHRIGGGGMAEVFLARHRLHGGFFAIKVLADHLARDPRIVARFEQEARTAASLSGHPNIVPIFDIGKDNGLHYLIMQYVSGEDLGSYLSREGKLQPPFAANIVAQTAEGLSWSASKSVVHRDLKPSNILLDVTGRAILLDFGISKITDIADGLTRPGESLGTPYYMSPEQIRGEGCDIRSDLYSLGVIFFELLTGSRPFDNESSTAVQMAHLGTPPPSLLQYNPELPGACDHIVQKLLQKRPVDRYQTPAELLQELYALGASSGPSTLRPYIDPSLATDLLQTHPVEIMEMDPPRAQSATSNAVNLDSQRLTTRVATTIEAPLEEAAATSSSAHRRTAWMIAAGGSSLVMVLAIVFLLLFTLSRPKSTISDSHGKMLLVPAGKFIFGRSSPDSPNPQQELSLPAFYVDETEVSNKEYRAFCDATGHPLPAGESSADPDLPVAGVTLEDAKAYATWSGKRLPTEQEWEKAARGTDGRVFPWGAAEWMQDVPTQLQPVSSIPERKSPSGALNMAGNVFEWTTSKFPAGDQEYTDMERLLGSSSFSRSWYVIKGGSFSSQGSVFFRSYLRRGFPSDQHSPWIGFRCVRDSSQSGSFAR